MTISESLPRLDELVVADAGLVRIRTKHPSDFANDYAWRTDPEIARFDGNPPLAMPFDEFEAQLLRDLTFGNPARCGFSIESNEGEHIGNIMYYNAGSGGDSAEIGITVGPEAWRDRGVGTAATAAFVRYLWATHTFRVLYLHTLEWNLRAQRCFQRAGFDAAARVIRLNQPFVYMEARREWWLLWDSEGRFPPLLPKDARG